MSAKYTLSEIAAYTRISLPETWTAAQLAALEAAFLRRKQARDAYDAAKNARLGPETGIMALVRYGCPDTTSAGVYEYYKEPVG